MAGQTIPAGLRAPRSGNAAEDRARADQTVDLSGVLKAPLLKAVLVERVTLAPGPAKPVAHKLGRELAGWLVSRPSTPAGVWEVRANRDTLDLATTGSISFDLWVW